jgi:glycosyltransferase involved in cell wall biosynthesis
VKRDSPRQDYLEIGHLLGGDVVSTEPGGGFGHRLLHRFENYTRLNFSEAFWVSRHINQHTAVLSTSEKIAIPLAAILAVKRQHVPHVVIAHRLTSRFKHALFRLWPLHHSFSQVICLSRAQADFAVNKMGLPPDTVTFVHDKVDHHFFRPMPQAGPTAQADGEYILAVGRERRDYETLLAAVAGTGLKLIIVASSLWTGRHRMKADEVPENVTIVRYIPHLRLRELYANARLVVTPLFDVPYAAGVNATLEAMAMAKPHIVTRTAGICDYVVDDETGIYTPPENPQVLRQKILHLWHNPADGRRLGENARQAVDEGMNLDTYSRRIAQLVLEASGA